MRRRVLAFSGIAVLAGCSVVLGLDAPSYDDRTTEGGVTPTPGVDRIDAPATPLPGKIDDPTRWSTYKSQGASYVAGPFDGRFVYFLRAADDDGPVEGGLTGSRILRYDTKNTGKFDDPAAWTAFDPEISVGTTGPHLTAILDGPWLVVAGYVDGVFIRFNTTSPPNDFGFASSWQRFDASTLATNSIGYDTALPLADGGVAYSNAGRLSALKHTGDTFDAGWQVAAFDAGPGGTFGCSATREGACVGTNLYLGPSASATTACLVRYDETKPFNAQASWESFDINGLGDEFAYFHGTITTDKHLYFTQYFTRDAAAPVKLLRRPLTGALDAGWESAPTNMKNPLTRGFIGGAFDGRFLYLSPYPAGTQAVFYTRYDTTMALSDAAAWDAVPAAVLGIPANRSWGAIFDGQYVYYTSYAALDNGGATFARFKAYDAKIPLPPTCR